MSSKIKYIPWGEIATEISNLNTDQVVLIIDQNLWQLYSKDFKSILKIDGKQVILWKAPDGEKVKNINEYETCLEFLIEKGIHRKAHIVAIGGGATSDFAGFIASSVLRGVSWSVVPTTLLSMIDASIGGKVAINSKFGKNLIGAFHLPSNIWMDFNFLKTLPEVEYDSGKGELLKYCFLNSSIYSEMKEKGFSENIIEMCAKYKFDLTNGDLKEQGNRKILNLGHTFGHAVEKIYQIPHGYSVVWGMVMIFLITGKENHLYTLRNLIEIADVKLTEPPWFQKSIPINEIIEYVEKDKKKSSLTQVELININQIGDSVITPVELSDVEKYFKDNENELRVFCF